MLPIDFLERMKELLGDEYDSFLSSFDTQEYKALRLNPLKVDKAQFVMRAQDGSAVDFENVDWEDMGLYYDESVLRPGKHPYHEAGAYYIQEPSAMFPVGLLDVKPGECILDMCAAPGGKTTQIAGRMQGKGLLICNEIIPNRARILSENIERMGVRNALVLNETPDKLRDTFVQYFDKILVDAPCSGEGMFRKNNDAAAEWSVDNVKMCANRQDDILDCASDMLKPGGILVYSTCTFSREEDEECMERFISRHPDYELVESHRLFPHKIKGEGHYAAKLRRKSGGNSGYSATGGITGISFESFLNGDVADFNISRSKKTEKNKQSTINQGRNKKSKINAKASYTGKASGQDLYNELREFVLDTINMDKLEFDGVLIMFGDNLYLLPENAPGLNGLKVMRPGLQLGSFVKNRFEPSHSLALALKADAVKHTVELNDLDNAMGMKMAYNYIEGLTFNYEGDNGWYLITIDGYSLGWGRLAGNVMKNYYPKGLRKHLT